MAFHSTALRRVDVYATSMRSISIYKYLQAQKQQPTSKEAGCLKGITAAPYSPMQLPTQYHRRRRT
jgi:hypothetical protein